MVGRGMRVAEEVWVFVLNIKVHCWSLSLCLSSIHIYSTINQAALLFICECGTVGIL